MIKNKKIFKISLLLIVTLITVTTVMASNTDNSTDAATHITTASQTDNEINTCNYINKKQTDNSDDKNKQAGTKQITNATYNNYFANTTTFIPKTTSQISQGDTIDLQGTFTNMDFVIDKQNITLTSINKNAKLYNCTVYVQNTGAGSTISNMDIYNTNKENAIGIYINNTQNMIIENNHVIIDDCSYSFAFAGSLNNSIIRSNYFETLSTTTERTHTSCVLGKSNYNLITNNTVKSDEANGIYFSPHASGRFIMAGSCNNNNITNNNVSGSNGTWVNLIQTSGNNNKIDYNKVTGGYEGIVVLGGNAILTNNQVNGPKKYGMDIQDDGSLEYTNTIISNNNITVTDSTDAIRVFKNTQITNNNINSENAYGIYIKSGEDCANLNITRNNITSTNSTAIYTKGLANHIIIEDNKINTKQEGINFGQQSITQRPNNIMVNNNNITTQTDYAINFLNAGSRITSQINITVTDTNILTSTRGTGLHTSYLPPTNNQTIPPVRTQIQINPIVASYGKPVNITATITPRDASTINQGNIIFTDNTGQQIATAQITSNQSTITATFTDTNITQITATYSENENYTASQNTTSLTITINTEELLELIQKLEEENNNLTQALQNNQTQINQLNTENEQLQQQIREYNSTINEQRQHIQEQNTQINTLNNTVNTLTKENVMLKNNLTQQENTIKTLNNKINSLNNELFSLNKTITQQKQQLQEYVTKINKQNEENKQLININNNLNQTIKELTTKQNTKLTIKNIPQTKYSNYIKITGNLTDNKGNGLKNQIITIKINNKEEKVITNKQGIYTYNLKADTIGTNKVTIKYEQTDKYNTNNQNTTFNVQKQGLNININNIKQTKYGNNITINGTFKDDNKKGLMNTVLRITINGKTTKIKTSVNGTFTYTTPTNKIGTNNITITYPGNKNYKSVTKKATFKVIKQDIIIKINPIVPTKYTDNTTITGTILDANGKIIQNSKITVKTDQKTYTTKTDKYGNYKISIKTTNAGTNNLTISCPGNTNYNKKQQKTTYKVNKQNTKISINKISHTNNKITLGGTLTDNNDNTLKNSNIKITVNSKTKTLKTNSKGVYMYTQNTTKKQLNITLTYNGNKNYNKYKKTTILTLT